MPSFLKQLGQYAIGQVAANLPTLLTIGAGVANGAINRIPGPPIVRTLIKGTVATSIAVLAHNGSSPATPASSAVQAALSRPAKAK